MSEYANTIGLRGIAANIGSCYEKSFLAFQKGNTELAIEWDILGSDMTFIGRQKARGGNQDERLDAEYVALIARWDRLNGLQN